MTRVAPVTVAPHEVQPVPGPSARVPTVSRVGRVVVPSAKGSVLREVSDMQILKQRKAAQAKANKSGECGKSG